MRETLQGKTVPTDRRHAIWAAAISITCSLLLVGVAIAATNTFSSQQAESGTRIGSVGTISDTTASGSSAVRFGQSQEVGSCPVPQRLTITSGNQAEYPNYSLGTQVYIPGGPDPWRDGTDTLGGCFPGPDNTGVPAGTTLANYVASLPARNVDAGHLNDNFYYTSEGTCYIKAPNTVIENQQVNCNLRIRSKNVQIKNSFVQGTIYIDTDWCEGSGHAMAGTSSLIMTDSTVYNPSPYGGRTVGMCDYTVTRSKLYGGPSVASCTNCTVQDSYMYLDDSSADELYGIMHNSVIRVGPRANLIHNTFQCHIKYYENTGATNDPTEESGCSANQTAYSHDGLVPYDSTIKRNFYMSTSGSYCAWGGSTSGENNLSDGVHDIRFIENIFQRKRSPVVNATQGTIGYYTGVNCGGFGPIANFYDRTGNIWQCNRWDNGAELTSPLANPVRATNISC